MGNEVQQDLIVNSAHLNSKLFSAPVIYISNIKLNVQSSLNSVFYVSCSICDITLNVLCIINI